MPWKNRQLTATSFLVIGIMLISMPDFVLADHESSSHEVRYGRDIRPILSDRCFICHGPDEANRKAGLRLDSFEEAAADREGEAAVVPGDPYASLLLARISHTDIDERMPPEGSNKNHLTLDQIELIRRWIEQGAEYEDHWAFQPPARPDVPGVEDEEWCRGDIDRYILSSLEMAGISPGADADRGTLVRRVYLDLTGLPPTPEESISFVEDDSVDAYESLVRRLLEEEPYRTRHAERMATPWLDLARYADTSGIHMDAGRSMWLYRDWVISAYRDNMPFDTFVINQMAGDLLPDATLEQLTATGFNRAHVTSDEGGAINDEYLLEYAVDRVNTLGEVFLGLTVGCARCHDHKFDPITSEDYYGLIAFFNNIEEPGIYTQIPDPYRALEPSIDVPDAGASDRISELDGELESLRTRQDDPGFDEQALIDTFVAELRTGSSLSWSVPAVASALSRGGATMTVQADESVLASGENPSTDEHTIRLRTDRTDLRALLMEILGDPSHTEGRVGRAANGNAILSGISADVISIVDPSQQSRITFSWAWADVEQGDGDFRITNVLRPDDGRVWAVAGHAIPGNRHAVFIASEPFGYVGGSTITIRLGYESPYSMHVFGRVRFHVSPVDDGALAQLPPATTSWYRAGPFTEPAGVAAYDEVHGPEEGGPLDFGRKYGEQSWRYAPEVAEAKTVPLASTVGSEYVAREIYVASARMMDLSLGSDDGLQVYLNGTRAFERRIDRAVAPDQEQLSIQLQPGLNTLVCKVVNTGGAAGIYHRAIPPLDEVPSNAIAFALPDALITDSHLSKAGEAWRLKYSPQYREITDRIKTATAERADVVATIPKTMIMKERAMPRDTFVMTRGQYDQPDTSRQVSRSIPVVLGTLGAPQSPTRIDLARWLTGPENPLTARVTVNRYWEIFFGRGLVETSNDFGMQGSWPSHPELLDWLAIEFQESGWDIRKLVYAIVTSSTYRQNAATREEIVEIDPSNTLLSWYPRQRLTAEQIRDQALYVSGLLVEKMGGPGVKPYQPEGLWKEVAMPQSNTRNFMRSSGEGLWRRSVYTYWKRAAPPPAMMTLDAPTREYCAGVGRISTNTPLQALVLWNDEQFVEAARNAAERTLRGPGPDMVRIDNICRRITGSSPSAETALAIEEALHAYRARYVVAIEDAQMLIGLGESPVPADIPVEELASWTLIANALLSSDAAIVKD